jgi:formylglycine-generating enzyme required for sulfatase activity
MNIKKARLLHSLTHSLSNFLNTFLALALGVALALPISACEAKAKPFKGETYRTPDGGTVIRIYSADELEIKKGHDPNIVAKYTLEEGGKKLRVSFTALGTTIATYYEITNDGIVDEHGTTHYSTAALDQRLKAEAARGAEARKGVMVPIKGGCFDMGDTFGGGGSDEKPVHRVCLDDFKMDKYEVTQSAYQSAMGNNPSYHEKDCPDCPVEQVTWDEAKAYCENVGKRLPTEAEWEYSARDGGKNVKYGTGKNEISKSDANYDSSGTKPVGSYAPNALGLHDMAGNVWEWVADWHGAYSSGEQKNPKGPSSGARRVVRGGSWLGDPDYVRASFRDRAVPSFRTYAGGFRCVQ